MLDQEAIKAIIPHREPFIMIDEIDEIIDGKIAIGRKYVTGQEDFFRGHFPDYPIMPGVLMIEALAQLGAACILQEERFRGKIGVLAGVKNARFKKQVHPGDTLEMRVELIKIKGNIGIAQGEAKVADDIACTTEITFAIVDAQ